MIMNYSFLLFTFYWVGVFFQIPASYPFSASPILMIPGASPGFIAGSLLNQQLLSVGDEYEVGQNETLIVELPGVMGNDTYDEGAIAVLIGPSPSHGEVSLNPNGSFSYTPVADYIGLDTFTYRLELDEIFSEAAVVQISVLDTEPPQVLWISPVFEGEVLVVEYERILLEAEAMDNGPLAGVLFYRWDPYLGDEGDYVDIAFVESAPYQYELDTRSLNPGWNQVFARAIDAENNPSQRSSIWLFLIPRIYFPIIFHG